VSMSAIITEDDGGIERLIGTVKLVKEE
jgi:hypothetical protein